jgi:putative oxidoreductase
MKYIVLIGRILFSAIFLSSALNHFGGQAIGYAAGKGVPMAGLLVPLSGILLLLGGLSVLLGYKAKIGAWMLVLFLIPVTLVMHDFWNVADAMMSRMQMAMFMKNISMLGGAFIITYFGAGPISIDAAMQKPKKKTEARKMAA